MISYEASIGHGDVSTLFRTKNSSTLFLLHKIPITLYFCMKYRHFLMTSDNIELMASNKNWNHRLTIPMYLTLIKMAINEMFKRIKTIRLFCPRSLIILLTLSASPLFAATYIQVAAYSSLPSITFHSTAKAEILSTPKMAQTKSSLVATTHITPTIDKAQPAQIYHHPTPTPPLIPTRLWNLRQVDIRRVIEEVSRETGKNFIVDPRVQGKISIISTTPINAHAVYQMFLSALNVLVSGKNTGMGCHFLLQGIFLTQESNPRLLSLLHWQADALTLSHLGSPHIVVDAY